MDTVQIGAIRYTIGLRHPIEMGGSQHFNPCIAAMFLALAPIGMLFPQDIITKLTRGLAESALKEMLRSQISRRSWRIHS